MKLAGCYCGSLKCSILLVLRQMFHNRYVTGRRMDMDFKSIPFFAGLSDGLCYLTAIYLVPHWIEGIIYCKEILQYQPVFIIALLSGTSEIDRVSQKCIQNSVNHLMEL